MSTKLNTELHDYFSTYAVTFKLQLHALASVILTLFQGTEDDKSQMCGVDS